MKETTGFNQNPTRKCPNIPPVQKRSFVCLDHHFVHYTIVKLLCFMFFLSTRIVHFLRAQVYI